LDNPLWGIRVDIGMSAFSSAIDITDLELRACHQD
jgi:hypothetical protein